MEEGGREGGGGEGGGGVERERVREGEREVTVTSITRTW